MAGYKPRVQTRPFQSVYENKLKRGTGTHRTYRSWESMLMRCYDQNAIGYDRYGGAGILVCDRWRFGENGKAGFDCFVDDMGLRPEGLSLDRCDGDKGYFKENCQWATRAEQVINSTAPLWTTINNETLNLSEISKRYGIANSTLSQRWAKGWRGERLIRMPRSYPTVMLTVGGETKTVTEWAKLKGVPRLSLVYRIKAGWPEEDLFRKPDMSAPKHIRQKP
jgi:hypothetical protein